MARASLVVVMLAWAATAALSPAMAQGHRRAQDDPKSAQVDLRKKKADDEAYQRALKQIPEPKGKIDPWQGAR